MMGASVRIEDEAFSDERYDDLATFAGLADADHARGKMARIWRQCTLEQTYEIETHMALRILGPNAIDALVRARLGELTGDDRVRIRGTNGRIEWLGRLRSNGKHGAKGGRPKKPTRVSKNGEIKTPPAPAPAPSESTYVDSREARALATRLLDLVLANHPNTKLARRMADGSRDGIVGAWAKDVTALSREGIADTDIARVIEWSTRDDYWRAVIISTKALKKNWDTIIAQMGRPARAHVNGAHVGRVRPEDMDYSDNEPDWQRERDAKGRMPWE